MAGQCCEKCVGLNEKLERVLKEVEELKRILTAQGVDTSLGPNIDDADAELSDYDSEKDEDPRLYLQPEIWVPKFCPIPGSVSKLSSIPLRLRPYPDPFAPYTPSPGPSPNSPPSPSNISHQPSPKSPRFALSPSATNCPRLR